MTSFYLNFIVLYLMMKMFDEYFIHMHKTNNKNNVKTAHSLNIKQPCLLYNNTMPMLVRCIICPIWL